MQIENKRLYTWRERIHKRMQKHGTHKIESKTYKTKKKTNTKRIIKKQNYYLEHKKEQ